MGALDTLGKFCVALQGQNYAAYDLLDTAFTSLVTVADFTTNSQVQDQIDGTVSACALEQVSAATNSTTPVQVSLTEKGFSLPQAAAFEGAR